MHAYMKSPLTDMHCIVFSFLGLYSVVKYWQARGLSGFLVYKFALKRCDGQSSPPWEHSDEEENKDPDATESDSS